MVELCSSVCRIINSRKLQTLRNNKKENKTSKKVFFSLFVSSKTCLVRSLTNTHSVRSCSLFHFVRAPLNVCCCDKCVHVASILALCWFTAINNNSSQFFISLLGCVLCLRTRCIGNVDVLSKITIKFRTRFSDDDGKNMLHVN